MSIERTVALLTPVFAALSGALTGWLAHHFPGLPRLSPADVTALQIAGVTAGAAAALKWLHGRAAFVQAQAWIEHADKNAEDATGPALADIEAVVKSHTDQVLDAVAAAVHAPPSVQEVVAQIGQELSGGAVSTPPVGTPPPPPLP